MSNIKSKKEKVKIFLFEIINNFLRSSLYVISFSEQIYIEILIQMLIIGSMK